MKPFMPLLPRELFPRPVANHGDGWGWSKKSEINPSGFSSVVVLRNLIDRTLEHRDDD